ncbi:MAG: hypothetical protein KME17_27240 [Cyanosarcina radialis HA8281-LM2]|jgi:WD40 repeat protein|nr:hypothetical protein [Cyanosarcina radialis HA8281-LM2]
MEDIALNNERSLQTLVRAIMLSQGEFTLILTRCNYRALRDRLWQQLQEICPVKIRPLVLPESVKTLYTTIEAELKSDRPPALIVFGLESVKDLDTVFTATNYVREEFRKNFSFPVVLWIDDEVLTQLIRLAPDFESWATTIEFELSTDKLLEFLRQTADEVFARVIEVGADVFLDNSALNLEIGSPRRAELQLARKDLLRRGVNLSAELEACREFVLGRDAGISMEQAYQHYQSSLAFWEQSDNLEWRGCLLFCLGLWWRTYAVRDRSQYVSACAHAKEYYQRCLQVLESRPQWQAKFINALGEVLQRLQEWNELEVVALAAQALHQTDSHPVRLAYSYGLLAEVALAKSAWRQARQYVEIAREILNKTAFIGNRSPHPACGSPLPMGEGLGVRAETAESNLKLERSWQADEGWYLLLLAQSQQHLKYTSAAIANLEIARTKSQPEFNPALYIRILETLRSLYFQRGEYLKAFRLKQEQRSIEYQYGFRTFIGSGQLRLKRQVINPGLLLSNNSIAFNQELTATIRQHDIECLIKDRISRSDRKLTILYGQSGVGKTSTIEIGLIPALKQTSIDGCNLLPVVLSSYTNWVQEFGKSLSSALKDTKNISLPKSLDFLTAIIEQLERNIDRRLMTVLILDRFEEFFFVVDKLSKRESFYQFLSLCLNTPFVNVILSIQENYLPRLLEWERLTNLDIINNDILSKDIRYYIGKFSIKEAKSYVQSLMARSQLQFQPAAIDAFLEDLADSSNMVSPVELQILGSQLETDKITTLKAYEELGTNPKEEAIERYLEAAIADCGLENRLVARLALFLLTDENNIRPLKTRAELIEKIEAAGLALETDQIDVVLEILVGAGLVCRVRETPAVGEASCSATYRYQLIHDYLVNFIRQQQPPGLQAELVVTREKQRLTQEKLERALQQLRRSLNQQQQAQNRAEIAEIEAINSLSQALWRSDDELGALVAAVKAGRKLQQTLVSPDIELQVVANLQQIVGSIQECDRFQGHSARILSVCFSPFAQRSRSRSVSEGDREFPPTPLNKGGEGGILASASEDSTINLWKLDGTLLTTLRGHSLGVNSISFSPDGQMLVSGSTDKTVKLWRIDGTELQTFKGHKDWVLAVSFSPDGQVIASAGNDKTIELWHLDGTHLQTLKGHRGWVRSVSFSPFAQRSRREFPPTPLKKGGVGASLPSGIGGTLASASDDGTIKLWSLDGTLLETFSRHHTKIRSITFSPDGQILASASDDGAIDLWNLDGTRLETFSAHNAIIRSVSFSPDGQILASASDDGTVKLWSLEGFLLQTFKGHSSRSRSISFSPLLPNSACQEILAAASDDGAVKLWRLDRITKPSHQGHTARVSSVSFSPDGRMLASASEDKTIKLWNLEGTELQTFRGHSAWVRSISFSPDGKMIASASEDRTVKIWSVDGSLITTCKGHRDRVRSVSFSPDCQSIASASDDKTVKLWSIDGRELQTFLGHHNWIWGVSFSPDGKFIASASDDKTIKLWSIDGRELQTFLGHTHWVRSVSFSPDGKFITSASDDKTIKLWSIDGRELLTFYGHQDAVSSVSFSRDGKFIASASDDKTVKIWNLEGQEIQTFSGHDRSVNSISFSPQCKLVASASDDRTVRVWQLNPIVSPLELEPLLERGCKWLRNYLTNNPNISDRDRHLCDGESI